MSDTSWPDAGVRYEFPIDNQTNTRRWQDAFDAALTNKALSLEPSEPGSTFVDISGSCPRCGHAMLQSIEFAIVVGVEPVETETGIFNVVCNCTEGHAGRASADRGCGWGGANPVTISRPS